MAEPNCGKCGSTEFLSMYETFALQIGILVYCGSCGAVVTWVPKPKT